MAVNFAQVKGTRFGKVALPPFHREPWLLLLSEHKEAATSRITASSCSGLLVGISRNAGGLAPLPSEDVHAVQGPLEDKGLLMMLICDFAGTQIFLGSWDALGLFTWKSQALH